jgi:CRISPR-associated exonuclease Cas4
MYSEDDLLSISALSHLVFCERRCALIHIEQIWSENLFTAQGRVLHERAHSQTNENRRDLRVEFGMALRSLRLGLIGKADVIEFHRQSDGTWQPFPVEYKRGRKKPDDCDLVQLCAQAMCLEETIQCLVPQGAIFYGKERRRTEVVFDESLRARTEATVLRLRALISAGVTPKAVYKPACERCSLVSYCLPRVMQQAQPVGDYLKEATGL